MKDEALDNDCTSAAPINVHRTEPRPPEMAIIPGVIDSKSNFVEHPEVVAQRIERVVDALGQPFNKEHPEINVISNVIENGLPMGNLGDGEIAWHANMTFNEVPPKASLLYGREIPDTDNNTYFANMYAAYDSLPVDLKGQIDGRIAIHDASHNSAGMTRSGFNEATDVRKTPGARHPLVRTHPQTRRKCRFLAAGQEPTLSG